MFLVSFPCLCRSLWEGYFLSPELRYDGCSKADDTTFDVQHEHPTKGPQKMSDNKQVQSSAIFPTDQCAARYAYSGHALRDWKGGFGTYHPLQGQDVSIVKSNAMLQLFHPLI